MLFKQKPIKGIISAIVLITMFVCIIAIAVCLIDYRITILILLGDCFLAVIMLPMIQWFYVYEDRIEVISIFGKVNEVYFSNVSNVIEKDLPVFRTFVAHYVFDDNRKEKHFFETTYQNHHNTMVRIYVTDELRSFIKRKNFNVVEYQKY